MPIFISVGTTIECVAIAIVFAFALLFISYKPLGVLQSCGYSGKKLCAWLGKSSNMLYDRLCLLSLACFLSSAVLGLCFCFAGRWASVISLVGYIAFFVLYIYADKKTALRCPATPTPRFKRLMAILWLVCAIIAYILVTLINFCDHLLGVAAFNVLKYSILALLPLIAVPLICLANSIAKIYEVPHNKKYIQRAKEKLATSNVKVVGITGSYAKTTSKVILTAMLSKKYKVLATPRSFNTPMGIATTIDQNDLKDCDIFIAEMGARNQGDIAQLCGLFPPDYALITGICLQHIESFLTVENIIKTKAEILSATKNTCYIAGDCYDLFEGFEGNKVKCDCVKNVVATCKGTTFTLALAGQERSVSCKLLGEHSAYNIGLCAQLACALGVELDDIVDAITHLDFIPHRLQLMQSGGINILDDGYNSNVKGAQAAIKVLHSFDGRKIVVTPGLVELGVLEEQENQALGKQLVGLDRVILVGDTLVGAVKNGYLEGGGDEAKISIAPTLYAAQEELKGYLTKGDCVLFLNDLPDMY